MDSSQKRNLEVSFAVSLNKLLNKTVELLVIWDAISLKWHHSNPYLICGCEIWWIIHTVSILLCSDVVLYVLNLPRYFRVVSLPVNINMSRDNLRYVEHSWKHADWHMSMCLGEKQASATAMLIPLCLCCHINHIAPLVLNYTNYVQRRWVQQHMTLFVMDGFIFSLS